MLFYADGVRVKVAGLQHMRAVVGKSQIRKRGFGFSTCGKKYHLIAAVRFEGGFTFLAERSC